MESFVALLLQFIIPITGDPIAADFDRAMDWPAVGEHRLVILTPKVLEISLINTQAQPGGWDYTQDPPPMLPPLTRPTAWDFLTFFGPQPNAPTAADFEVLVEGQPATITNVGFARRSIVAPLKPRDLRISNSIFLVIDQPIAAGATVTVANTPTAPNPVLTGLAYSAMAGPNRLNPAIHVNQVGFMPIWPDQSEASKRAFVGYSLGDLGELKVDDTQGIGLATGFEIIRADDNTVVYPTTGPKPFTLRQDGTFSASFYKHVLEADFSEFTTPGEYRLRVPGLGASLPFRIDADIPATLARTYALGLYQQRSGQAKSLPYTRFTDAADHLAPATMPFDHNQYASLYGRVAANSAAAFAPGNIDPAHTAPQARDADSLRYPFVGDLLAWWPMDGEYVTAPESVVLGFNETMHAPAVSTDPFGDGTIPAAFAAKPARALGRGQQAAFGELGRFVGHGFANSYAPDSTIDPVEDLAASQASAVLPTGLLASPGFLVTGPCLAFLVGGSNQPYDLLAGGQQTGVTAINLVVGETVVRTASGTGPNALAWQTWDVTEILGQTARLELVDSSATGFLLADEIHFLDKSAIKDISSHRRHATAIGQPTPILSAGAPFAGALGFDGLGDHLLSEGLGSLASQTEVTFSFWARISTLTRTQGLFSQATSTETAEGLAVWFDGLTRQIHARFGSVTLAGTERPIVDDGWHFIAVRCKAGDAAGLEAFVDGLPIAPAPADTTGLMAVSSGLAPFVLGNFSDLPADQFFHGVMDDFRVRAKFVSTAELAGAGEGDGPWIDIAGGHFDAGDYSKYMINSALTVEALAFAVDHVLAIPGVPPPPSLGPDLADNLGVPESNDGICDVLQEAKWEADYIAKMQDTDGGFFFLAQPRSRSFEDNVLPSKGDVQAVWPKSLAATGAGTAALATLAGSPAFRRHYPQAAADYLAKALAGWQFILQAVQAHGLAGADQRLTHYGVEFQARDEIAWAAAALFAATGDPAYEAKLKEWLPFDPTLQYGIYLVGFRQSRRYTWERLYEAAGAALRAYVFADKHARQGSAIARDPVLVGEKSYYLHVVDEIQAAGQDALDWSNDHPYRTSFAVHYKAIHAGAYHFPETLAFDLVVAQLLAPNAAFHAATTSNFDYQLGGNPVNISFVSGLGRGRLRDFVSLFALNDERKLPPSGFMDGSISASTAYLNHYQRLLAELTYPSDFAKAYPFFDRYTDSWNPTNEFVVPQQAKALAASVHLLALAGAAATPWNAPPTVLLLGLPAEPQAGLPYSLSLMATEVPNLAEAQIVWEARGGQPKMGPTYVYTAPVPGEHWIEAEVLWKDGRRSFLHQPVTVKAEVTNRIEHYQPPENPPATSFYERIANVPATRLYYPLDDHVGDIKLGVPLFNPNDPAEYDLQLVGHAALEVGPFEWPAYATIRPNTRTVRLRGPGDKLVSRNTIKNALLFPSGCRWFSLELMLHISAFNNANQRHALLPWMYLGDSTLAKLHVIRFHWADETNLQLHNDDLALVTPHLPIGQWLHVKLYVDEDKTGLFVDGQFVRLLPTDQLRHWITPNKIVEFGLGHFDGWVDDLIFKADATRPPVGTTFALWREGQFTAEQLADPLISGPLADPEADGASNFHEYAVGGQALLAEDHAPDIAFSPDGATFELAFTRRQNRVDASHVLQMSEDLLSWNDVDPQPIATVTYDGEGQETVRYPGLDATTLASRFFRVASRTTP